MLAVLAFNKQKNKHIWVFFFSIIIIIIFKILLDPEPIPGVLYRNPPYMGPSQYTIFQTHSHTGAMQYSQTTYWFWYHILVPFWQIRGNHLVREHSENPDTCKPLNRPCELPMCPHLSATPQTQTQEIQSGIITLPGKHYTVTHWLTDFTDSLITRVVNMCQTTIKDLFSKLILLYSQYNTVKYIRFNSHHSR